MSEYRKCYSMIVVVIGIRRSCVMPLICMYDIRFVVVEWFFNSHTHMNMDALKRKTQCIYNLHNRM